MRKAKANPKAEEKIVKKVSNKGAKKVKPAKVAKAAKKTVVGDKKKKADEGPLTKAEAISMVSDYLKKNVMYANLTDSLLAKVEENILGIFRRAFPKTTHKTFADVYSENGEFRARIAYRSLAGGEFSVINVRLAPPDED